MTFARTPSFALWALRLFAAMLILLGIVIGLALAIGFLIGRAHAENSYTVLILVCSLGVTPDLSRCDRSNAVAVIEGEPEANVAMCGFHGQALLASTALGRDLRQDELLKVLCIRSRNGSVG